MQAACKLHASCMQAACKLHASCMQAACSPVGEGRACGHVSSAVCARGLLPPCRAWGGASGRWPTGRVVEASHTILWSTYSLLFHTSFGVSPHPSGKSESRRMALHVPVYPVTTAHLAACTRSVLLCSMAIRLELLRAERSVVSHVSANGTPRPRVGSARLQPHRTYHVRTGPRSRTTPNDCGLRGPPHNPCLSKIM